LGSIDDINFDRLIKERIPFFISEYYVLPLTIYSAWLSYWFSLISKPEGNEDTKFVYYSLFLLQSWTIWLGVLILIISIVGVRYAKKRKKQLDIIKTEKIELESKLSTSEYKVAELTDSLDENQLELISLRAEHQELLYQASTNYLLHLSNKVSDLQDKERVSLYLFNSDEFILVGRHSLHPNFLERNRIKFPSGEGCISDAFLNGSVSVSLPENHKEYLDYCVKHFNMQRNLIKEQRMKSRDFYGEAISDGKRRIGVILFESQKKGILNINELSTVISEHTDFLCALLEQSNSVNSFVLYKKEETNEKI